MGNFITSCRRVLSRMKAGEPEPVWRHDKAFMNLFRNVEDKILVSIDRAFIVCQLARALTEKGGDYAEVGVYRGGTARILARSAPGKPLHLFDTFRGMPAVNDEIDRHRESDFSGCSLPDVRHFLKDCPHVIFHPGFFPNTAEGLEKKLFCLVHIDVDIHRSVRDSLDFFYPRLVPGGVILIDDYGWKECPGIKIALDEFLAEKKESPILTAPYQCLILKI